MRKYYGYNGKEQTLDEHLAYLEECAQKWERGGGVVGAPAPDQARVVRDIKQRLINEAADGAIDDRQEGNVDQ